MSEQTTNPLLTRLNKMPGETIRLPSLGRFYTDGELDEEVVNGEITLYPMTMTDEIMMKSPDMLFQGTAIEHVFKRCSPQIKKPRDLLSMDVDYILTQLRKISFGPTIEVTYSCTKCDHENEVTVPLSHFVSSTKEIGPEDIANHLTLTTPVTGNVVVLKPVTFRDFLLLQQVNLDDLNSPENLESYIIDTYTSVIMSVDGILNNTEQNRGFIREWFSRLPREDSTAIADNLEHLQDWGTSFKYKSKCSKCKHSNELSTELNPTAFFMLPSSRKTTS